VKSVLDIKRSVMALQKEHEALTMLVQALAKQIDELLKEKPNGEKRPYVRRNPSSN
jgi:hypothetical protein